MIGSCLTGFFKLGLMDFMNEIADKFSAMSFLKSIKFISPPGSYGGSPARQRGQIINMAASGDTKYDPYPPGASSEEGREAAGESEEGGGGDRDAEGNWEGGTGPEEQRREEGNEEDPR